VGNAECGEVSEEVGSIHRPWPDAARLQTGA
jgi:hypothetical protein